MKSKIHSKPRSETVVEYRVKPGAKTPWHHHTLFSETFEILEGSLKIGKKGQVAVFHQGDRVTVAPNERHFFHNIGATESLIKVSVSPPNADFRDALLINSGLEKDGLTTSSGTPKRLKDLALFLRLNNSRMSGLAKVAEPFFGFIARTAIKSGYLNTLKNQYANI